jgi:hypothetical protein
LETAAANSGLTAFAIGARMIGMSIFSKRVKDVWNFSIACILSRYR